MAPTASSSAPSRMKGRGPLRMPGPARLLSSAGIRWTGRTSGVHRQAVGQGQTCRRRFVVAGEWIGRAVGGRNVQSQIHPFRETGNRAAGTAEDDLLDRRGALLGTVEIE